MSEFTDIVRDHAHHSENEMEYNVRNCTTDYIVGRQLVTYSSSAVRFYVFVSSLSAVIVNVFRVASSLSSLSSIVGGHSYDVRHSLKHLSDLKRLIHRYL